MPATRAQDAVMNLAHLPHEPPPDGDLRSHVIAALRRIRDPEIPINIYDLGLVYDLAIDNLNRVTIRMTLTAPACPVAQTFPALVEDAVAAVDGVSRANVELIWEPPWDTSRMNEAARLQLGLY